MDDVKKIKTWQCKNGRSIPYSQLTNVHLLHIIRLLQRKESDKGKSPKLPGLITEFNDRDMGRGLLCPITDYNLKAYRKKVGWSARRNEYLINED